MIENNPSWKELRFHKKVRYVLEIVAICGGLGLLVVNVIQVRLLSQSNETNRQMFSFTFPIEIQSDLVDFVDKNPLVIRLRLTNTTGRRMQLRTLIPRFVRVGFKVIEGTPAGITIDIFKQKDVSSPFTTHDLIQKIVLRPSDSCILKLCSELDVRGEYSGKNIFKPKPLQTAFIIVPVYIESFEQSTSKVILLSLSRDDNNSLVVTSEVFRGLDDKTLMLIMEITRAQHSPPKWE
jgi:hypothetical protein